MLSFLVNILIINLLSPPGSPPRIYYFDNCIDVLWPQLIMRLSLEHPYPVRTSCHPFLVFMLYEISSTLFFHCGHNLHYFLTVAINITLYLRPRIYSGLIETGLSVLKYQMTSPAFTSSSIPIFLLVLMTA